MSTPQSVAPIHVVKIGGSQIDDPDFLGGMVAAIREIRSQGIRPLIVHGGGQEIARLHSELGVPFDVVEGLRVTSEQSIRLVKMALNGIANLRVVRWLVNGGIDAIGLNGIDLGLIRVEKQLVNGVDLGRVGRITHVETARLSWLLDAGLVPVISPVSLGQDGLSYNVNADHVAETLAVSLQATRLVFLTNVPGVLIAGRTLRALAVDQIPELIAGEHISGGMVPKVRAAVAAVAADVPGVLICDLARYVSGEGTVIVKTAH